jgi:hypothetical protein
MAITTSSFSISIDPLDMKYSEINTSPRCTCVCLTWTAFCPGDRKSIRSALHSSCLLHSTSARLFFLCVLARASEVGSLVIRSAQGRRSPSKPRQLLGPPQIGRSLGTVYSCYRQLRHCLPPGKKIPAVATADYQTRWSAPSTAAATAPRSRSKSLGAGFGLLIRCCWQNSSYYLGEITCVVALL